jgi:hypothetical protein
MALSNPDPAMTQMTSRNLCEVTPNADQESDEAHKEADLGDKPICFSKLPSTET